MAPAKKKTAAEVRQPLFFERPQPLDTSRHKGVGIDTRVGFGFARHGVAIPVVIHELAEAALHYPVVFSQDDLPLPVVLTGLAKENRFISLKGEWDALAYVPLYVRKYPFAFLEVAGADAAQPSRFVLCVDEASPHFSSSPSQPFYENGEPSTLTRQALDLCRQFQASHLQTREWAAALHQNGLLEMQEMQASLPKGKQFGFGGFSVISPERWVEELKNNGAFWFDHDWVGITYLAIASQQHWKYLLAREQKNK